MTTAPALALDEQSVREADVPGLLASLLTLSAAAVADLSGDELLAGVQGFERVLSAVTAAQAEWLVALDVWTDDQAVTRPSALPPHQQLTEEVALALHVSGRTATARLEFADGLADLPATAAGLAVGRLGVAHARALVDGLTGLEPPPVADVVDHIDRVVSAEAIERGLTPGQVAQHVRRLLLARDPEGCVDRRQRATRGRSVSYRPDEHGMGWLSAYLPAHAGLACMRALDGHAERQRGCDPDDGRGIEALRADTLVNLILTGQADGNPPHDAAVPATVSVRLDVTVPVTALAGVSDEPGQLQGHRPIDASLVRLLADNPGTVLRRLLTDPTGDLVQVGTTSYRPTAGLDRLAGLPAAVAGLRPRPRGPVAGGSDGAGEPRRAVPPPPVEDTGRVRGQRCRAQAAGHYPPGTPAWPGAARRVAPPPGVSHLARQASRCSTRLSASR